ncbi:MAG: hypothetical protein ABIM89_05300, partial [Mycobacteriales bacterium]
MDLLPAVADAALRLRDAVPPGDCVPAAWHAADVGAAAALAMARLSALTVAPAYLIAADGFSRARRHLDGAHATATEDRVYPERISPGGASAEVCESALVDLAYRIGATLTDAMRPALDPDVL